MQAGTPTATRVIAMTKVTDANLIVVDGNIPNARTRFTPNSNAHTYAEGIVADRHIVCLPNLAIQILWESTIHRRRWRGATASARLDGNVIVADAYVVVFNHHIPAAVWIDPIHIWSIHSRSYDGVVYVNIGTINRMDCPEGRVSHGDMGYLQIRTVENLNKIGSSRRHGSAIALIEHLPPPGAAAINSTDSSYGHIVHVTTVEEGLVLQIM
mmetsp:Transcript_18995/g.44988  ORF Transcript_18995/g.44988 Transcript_18995/m.44988 type:complete len:212 (+) Transcript_18995:507-1142(+)